MSRTVWAFVLAVALVPAVGNAREPYQDPAYGFSITPPEFAVDKSLGFSITTVTFRGGLKEGGVPTCNVQIQNVSWTPEQYKELSLNQMSALGLTVTKEEKRTVSGKPAYLWRTGNDQLNILSLAVFDTSRVFLVTCSAPATLFPVVEPTFLEAIESFRLGQ